MSLCNMQEKLKPIQIIASRASRVRNMIINLGVVIEYGLGL